MSNIDEARKRVFIELHARLVRAVVDAGQAIPGERDGALRVDPYLAATNAMRVLPKVVFFDEPLRLRLHERFGPFIAKELLALLGEHTRHPDSFDGTLKAPRPDAVAGALTVFDNGPDGEDWIERAIADGVRSRERTLIGLSKEDVDGLTRSHYANCTLLVRFRSSNRDGRMVMTANDIMALADSDERYTVDPAFGYEDIRDIFPLRSVEEAPMQAQVV